MFSFETKNFRHDSETLLENNDFYKGSSFVGAMNESIYYTYENEISKFTINAKGEEIDKLIFVKADNSIPITKCLKEGEQFFTSIFEKYSCKIDCDGNVYKVIDSETLEWIGYYDFVKYNLEEGFNDEW